MTQRYEPRAPVGIGGAVRVSVGTEVSSMWVLGPAIRRRAPQIVGLRR